jgi:hypothetical protein
VSASWFSSVLFGVTYLVGVAMLMWVNTAVLCLGDPKFGGGCGGFDLYFPLWALFYTPIVATALLLTWSGKVRHLPRIRAKLLCAYLVLIMSALEWSFVTDSQWPILLIEWVILGMTFSVLRALALSRWRANG